MAITKMLNIKAQSSLFAAIDYTMKAEKTQEGLLIGGNAGSNSLEVYQTMMDTKNEWGKLDGRQGYHFILSWRPGETDSQTVYQMLHEFCEEYLGDAYDYVFSVHTDREHPHGHIVFNSVNRITGYKYRYKKGDWEKQIQPITDRISEKYHLEQLNYNKKNPAGISYAEWNKNAKMSWKKIIRADIDFAISRSDNMDDFQKILSEMGYEIKHGFSSKQDGEYLSLKAPGQNRAWRTKERTLGKEYTVPEIRKRIERKEDSQTYMFKKSPRLKKCYMKSIKSSLSGISGYQMKRVKDIYYVQNRFAIINPFAINQATVRKNLLQIDRLCEDCRYLFKWNIHNRSALEQRAKQLAERERFLKSQQQILFGIKADPRYQEYEILKSKIDSTAERDKNNLFIQMDKIMKELPKDASQAGSLLQKSKNELSSIRKEKRIIRHIRNNDTSMKDQSLPMFVN